MEDVTGPVGAGPIFGDVGGLVSSTGPLTTDGARNCKDGRMVRACGSPNVPNEFVRGNSRLALLAISGRRDPSYGGPRPGSIGELKDDASGLVRMPPWKEGSDGVRPGEIRYGGLGGAN